MSEQDGAGRGEFMQADAQQPAKDMKMASVHEEDLPEYANLTAGEVTQGGSHSVPVSEQGGRPTWIGNPESHSDDALLRLCAEGDEGAMQELVRRYQHSIHRFLMRYLDASEDAEQATLNVFIKAWQHARNFQFRASVSTWLFRIAINLAQDIHKRRRSQPQQQPWPQDHQLSGYAVGNAQDEAQCSLERQDRSVFLQSALAMLKEDDRLVLVLYYLEERSYDEIQAMTMLSNTVLKMRLTRARKRLRIALDAVQRNNA